MTNRPFGIRTALGLIFLAELEKDFATEGRKTIGKLREDRPYDYLKLIVSLLPEEVLDDKKTHESLTDDQALELLIDIRKALAAAPGDDPGADSERRADPEPEPKPS